MDIVTLSRLQFAVTTIYHFFFVPLTIGLSVLVAVMETIYVRSGNEAYKRMAKFWGKLFLINFAMGVVTGIVQEFQFGMNWSEYSRYVGDIFGAPLAIEALLAFFLESTFLGIWIFGWDKLPKGLHAVTIWMVAIGSNLSALWILIANSFMQQPQGYALEGGRAVMTDFSAVVFNSNVWLQFPHVVFSGLATASFFVIGISAYHLLRNKQEQDFFQRSFQIASVAGILAIFFVILVGHSQAQHMVQTQPMKMAAAEALWESEDPASFSLITIGDEPNRKDVFAIRIPGVLSLLSYNQFSGKVLGINDLQAMYEKQYGPGDYVPPIALSYWSFRIMVGAGFLMFAIAAYAIVQVMRKKVLAHRRLIALLPLAIVLPYLSNTFGWMLTELGRQPWVVFGLLKTSDAVSPILSPGLVLASLIGFTLVYGALMVADVYLLKKFSQRGPAIEQEATGKRSISDEAFWE
jgi:cytochrome bd ubiquinol oxidase subunit I